MILDAIEKVALMNENGDLLIGRQALRDALYATSGYEGITGTLTCNEFGDCADARISVNQVQDGAFVPIWP
jgi:branched-chain amino acid transport system substrate-binding protein